ncbi:GerMN domain-containing protein [Vampirovibrio chlorellavorus]|uniref:GerMN domain-containing protein n=1 Tax=Vampirovibrio chlorellavorus TaxID=758823 RepID=UPI0026EF8F3A|nr:GerMN domain-containing protein [Vampirovibrio chlorellavorus]
MPLFYLPPIKNQQYLPLRPEWLILLLGLLVLLATTWMVQQFAPHHRPLILQDWAVAKAETVKAEPVMAEPIIKDPPDDLGVAARPALRVQLALTTPVQAPRLTATATTSSLEAAITHLLQGQLGQGLKTTAGSEIPKGTRLLGLWTQGNTVTVNLSKTFNTGGGATSMIGRVTELQKVVQSVNPGYRLKIAIEGKPVPYVGGEGLELE